MVYLNITKNTHVYSISMSSAVMCLLERLQMAFVFVERFSSDPVLGRSRDYWWPLIEIVGFTVSGQLN